MKRSMNWWAGCACGVALAGGWATVPAAAQAAGEAAALVPREQYVRSGLATQEARVRATRGGGDDVAFARSLIDAAGKAPEAGLRALLYERALEMAGADLEGLETMRVAAAGLAEADPARGTAEELLLPALQRLQSVAGRGEDGPRIARLMAQQYERVGDAQAIDGRFNDAIAQYTRATSAYRQVAIDRGKPLAEKVALCREAGRDAAQDAARLRVAQTLRARLEATLSRLSAQLEHNPADAAAEQQRTLAAAPLARLLALEFVEHDAAAHAAKDCGDEEIETVIPLLTVDVAALEPEDAVRLGGWLASAADDVSLTSAARTRSTRRAVASLTHFLARAEDAHPQRWTAQQQHDRLKQRLASGDALAAALRASAPGMEVPEDAKAFNGHSYKVFIQQLSWHEARAKCEEMGGYLACITSEEEQKFVQGLNPLYGFWLGGSDARKMGQWEWADGSRSSFTYWAAGEPDDFTRDEDYLLMSYAGQWYDTDGSAAMSRGFICEWPFERPVEEEPTRAEPPTTPVPSRTVRVVRVPAVQPASPPATESVPEPAAAAPEAEPEPEPAAQPRPWPEITTTPEQPTPPPDPTPAVEPAPEPAPEPEASPEARPSDDEPMPGELFPGVKWREEK